MNKILTCLAAVLLSFSAVADQRSAVEAEVRDAVKAFETDVWQKIDGAWKVASLHYTEIAPE